MEFSKERIMLNKIGILGGYIAKDSVAIPSWRVEKGYYKAPGVYDRAPYAEAFVEGDHWKCSLCDTYWFSAEVAVPADWKGGRVYLDLDFGGEGLVRINGEIVSAVTSYLRASKQQRSRVYVDPALVGTTIRIEAECALNYLEFFYLDPSVAGKRLSDKNWVEYTLRKTRLILADDEIESFYFDAMVAYEALDEIGYPYDHVRQGNVKMPREISDFMYHNGGDSFIHSKVLEALQRSLTALDVDMGREALAASVPGAARILKEGLAAIDYIPRGHVVFTGNSHIDTAWLWPIRETVRKAAKTFANTLSLMEQYPNHVFAASQPWQYEQVKKHYPELFEKIRQRVQEGRWELIGNSWVEADSNIPSGEALIRQILYGREFFLKEFGKASAVYWMPDVFGYSWSLPQIIKRSGMKYFFTSKLNNSDLNRFPYTLFKWQGADGTRIPAYLQRMGYNGEVNPHHANHTWREFDQKSLTQTMLQTYGYGDGGGGATYQMLEYAPRLQHFPGLPDTSIDRTEAFYSKVPENGLPVWNDEMYYEFHRGTYTSQAFVKKSNRKGELGLRQAEMAASMAEILLGRAYPMEEITDSWKLLLLNQFHDIIPGSSIHEVYEDCRRDYAEMFRLMNSAQDKAAEALSGAVRTEADSVVVYNFLSWKRSGAVSVRVGSGKKYAKGAKCALKETDEGYVLTFTAEDVPAMGYKTYELTDSADSCEVCLSASETLIENDLIRVELDENGVITSVYDKQAKRETLSGRGNLLTVFEDKPEVESAWNIDIEYKNKFWTLDKADSVEVVECSPVRAALKVVRSFNKSRIEQEIVVCPGSRRIDFITHADWQETEKMLKAAFEADVLAPKATYEIACAAIERTTHENTTWDRAKFEVAAHKWADLSEGGYGVSVLNDCKYGYDIKDNVLRLTLLRSPVYPDPVADKGEHDFTYSFYPHEGGWREGGVVRAGYELNVPLTAVMTGAHEGSLPAEACWMEVEGWDGAVVDALKKSQDGEGYILRVYEANGGRGEVVIRTAFGLNEVWETNLMEEKEAQLTAEGNSFRFSIKPHEIKTFFIK